MAMLRFLIIPAALVLGASTIGRVDDIAFPDGYRTWTHIKTAVIEPANPAFQRFGGIHSIYASPAAMEGYRSGHFPDGSVIVFDVHETTTFQDIEQPGRRRFIDVMTKSGGSWRFGEFSGDSKTKRNVTMAQGETQCATCHAKSPTDHVFSRYDP
jgi:hypothetical protein